MTNFLRRVGEFFGMIGAVIGWLMINWWVPLSIGVLLVLVILFFSFCGSSPVIDQKEVQKQIDEKTKENNEDLKKTIDESNRQVANIEESANKALANINESVNNAVINANKIRNQNFTNTNLAESNRARCEAFPQSPECK